jgi:dTMP kinase
LLDVPAQVGLGRYKPKTKKRKQRQTHQMDIFDTDRIERESIDFHERVHTEFMRIANEEPERVKRVDGTGSIDEVATAVRVHVDLLLGEG